MEQHKNIMRERSVNIYSLLFAHSLPNTHYTLTQHSLLTHSSLTQCFTLLLITLTHRSLSLPSPDVSESLPPLEREEVNNRRSRQEVGSRPAPPSATRSPRGVGRPCYFLHPMLPPYTPMLPLATHATPCT